jgi:predicted permease
VSAWQSGHLVNLTDAPLPEQLRETRASANYFRLFAVPFAEGRSFTPDEDRPGGSNVVIVTDAFRRRHFAGDPQVVGKNISLSGVPYRIVGTIAAGFRTETASVTDVYRPFQIDPASRDHGDSLRIAARLKTGVNIAVARARLKALGDAYLRQFPGGLDPGQRFDVMPLKDDLVGDLIAPLLLMQGAVGFVLLIVCANIASLLLARANGRKREIAIRAAVGAGRGRIVRQLLTEGVILSGAGCVLGLVLGVTAIHALLAANPIDLVRIGPTGSPVTSDWRVCVFTVVVSFAAGLAFESVPAFQIARADVSAALKAGGGLPDMGFRQKNTRAALTVGEVALALVLLIGAGWQIRSFLGLRAVAPGFESHDVVTMEMSVSGPRFAQTSAVAELIRDGSRHVRTVPGVIAAGATFCMPFDCSLDLPFIIAGRPLNGISHGDTNWTPVSPGFFETMKIPLLRGRFFTDRDDAGSARVALINHALAQKFWPGGDPLLERLIVGRDLGPQYEDLPRQIVGVIGDIHDEGLDGAPKPAMYIPAAQINQRFNKAFREELFLTWVVRTQSAPTPLGASIQSALRSGSGGLPVANIRTMDDILSRSIAGENFAALLLSIFGACALLLAAIGIYGLMAYSVQQRTPEIGIRMALGSEPARVRNVVVYQGMRLALIGTAMGIAAALVLSSILASQFYGYQPHDPLVFSITPVLLFAVAFTAVWFPAQRASRINPIDAIRQG